MHLDTVSSSKKLDLNQGKQTKDVEVLIKCGINLLRCLQGYIPHCWSWMPGWKRSSSSSLCCQLQSRVQAVLAIFSTFIT